MRQKFDKGDLVSVVHSPSETGIILESALVHNGVLYPEECLWHVDEYHCKVKFLATNQTAWVRPKWLRHLSKISQ
tara:strand:- start:486 stop:710 length:225 start_codon:yes stop_codon:yes gene_type:complete